MVEESKNSSCQDQLDDCEYGSEANDTVDWDFPEDHQLADSKIDNNRFTLKSFKKVAPVREMDSSLQKFMDKFNDMTKKMAEKLKIALSDGFKDAKKYESRPQ